MSEIPDESAPEPVADVRARLAAATAALGRPGTRLSGAMGLGTALTSLTGAVALLTDQVEQLGARVAAMEQLDARVRRMEVVVAGDEQLLDDVGHALDELQRELDALRNRVDRSVDSG